VSLAVLALASCSDERASDLPLRRPVPAPTISTSRVIGLVGTMSGRDAWRGADAFEGADLAVNILNREREREELPLELVTLDDEGDPSRASAAVEELAASERTVGVIYAGPPEGLPRADAALARARIPALLVYGDLFSAGLLRPHLFQMSPPTAWQARRIVSYLARDRRYRSAGALVSEGFTGDTALASLRGAARGARLRISTARYDPATDEVREQLGDLRRRRVEAVVVEGDHVALVAVNEALETMGARYDSTADAKRGSRRTGRGSTRWSPQVVGFDETLAPSTTRSFVPGTVVAETYARGAHYLPIPSFDGFTTAFRSWWGDAPLGFEGRAYDAAHAIEWAARRTEPDEDVARTLEQLAGARFGGLDVTFQPNDHLAVDQGTLGLWVIPAPGARVAERGEVPRALPWVPLARGFSSDGRRTDIPPADWRWLFRSPAGAAAGRPPRVGAQRYGVTTSRLDPVH